MSIYLRVISTMWVFNLIAFVACLFMFDYAVHTNSWYEDSFQVLSFSFGISKFVLSVLLLVILAEECWPNNDL